MKLTEITNDWARTEWSSKGGLLYVGDCRSDEAMQEVGYGDATELAQAVEQAEPVTVQQFKKVARLPGSKFHRMLAPSNRNNIELSRDPDTDTYFLYDLKNDIHHFWG